MAALRTLCKSLGVEYSLRLGTFGMRAGAVLLALVAGVVAYAMGAGV